MVIIIKFGRWYLCIYSSSNILFCQVYILHISINIPPYISHHSGSYIYFRSIDVVIDQPSFLTISFSHVRLDKSTSSTRDLSICVWQTPWVKEWNDCLLEASLWKTGNQLWNLFVTIVIYCQVSDAGELWKANYAVLFEKQTEWWTSRSIHIARTWKYDAEIGKELTRRRWNATSWSLPIERDGEQSD